MVQIESAEAVASTEAILGTPGVDGCWVGPGALPPPHARVTGVLQKSPTRDY
jgi:2-keto-3-deoxy-L-rhamnonate aldolase RhmA